MSGGGKDDGGGTEIYSSAPPWMSDLGQWSSDKFKEQMGKQENFNPYPDMKNPYGEWKSLFSEEKGQDYLDAFSAKPKAAYNQALTDTKNMFGAKGMYGSVGNDLMSGAMASAGSQYANSMSDAQVKAQNAQAMDYYTSSEGQKWMNQNSMDKLNYENTMRQQVISNYLGSLGITIPTLGQSQVVEQSDDGGKGSGLGSFLGGVGSIAGAFMSSRDFKHNKRPAELVTEHVCSLPVERWQYKQGYGDQGEHIGPYAEDWAKRFGGSDRNINIVDAFGVCLKAIQELAEEIKELQKTVNKKDQTCPQL